MLITVFGNKLGPIIYSNAGRYSPSNANMYGDYVGYWQLKIESGECWILRFVSYF